MFLPLLNMGKVSTVHHDTLHIYILYSNISHPEIEVNEPFSKQEV
jgi:hypothetical protein